MATPWPEMLRLATLSLRIPPAAFWRLSVKEWRALTATSAAAPSRAALDHLLRLYPDDLP